ncbi:glycoside hydrolase family 13 protein [Anoxybacillus suryakundensis]|uniref:oligo-1,6-glucosidase n=1 Tax=Anoxybacillus suryakundensis TaxID=1325335 RepID=A0A0K6GL28_9BACL|nr:alpha-glucosidase [Anoxybacillus suryakundensis]CUA79263.1 Glycosidase [Anoxybacillus suryakundensis]
MESIPKTKQWWKEAVVYQIYPRSFKDSNGDGIGDLTGIIEKLDYLQELGVDVVWLSPVYKSPNDDNGYDISDYQDIMDEFGTLADWDELLSQMHARGMKLVMDLVVNHTSDEHHWFIESRKSKDNPYRDYYIWRPGKDGKEPNNWQSFFSGSAWQYDEATGEYYLHLFSKKQPDLNWENEKVREQIFTMMTWWLDRGIDGFRMDVINLLSKVEGLPDAPVTNPNDRYQWGGQYFVNGPKLMDYLREMKEKVLSKYDIMTVGETPMVTTDDAIRFTNEQDGVMNMLFQFEHMDVDTKPGSPLGKWDIQPWKLTDLKKIMSKWQVELHGKGWNSLYLENHDQPRSVSRFGDDKTYRVESAKMLATWLHMMQGTPYIYQGQEIGMTNVAFPSIEYYRDVETINLWNDVVVNKGYDRDKILKAIHYRGRDNARTPMQWDATEHAGFTTGTPWINVNPNYCDINVEQAMKDENSVFHYYKKLIRLRKEHPIIVYGSYELLLEDDEQIYAYVRKFNNEQLLVITNFSSEQPTFKLPAHITFTEKQLLISNYVVDENESIDTIVLKPYEARVYKLK